MLIKSTINSWPFDPLIRLSSFNPSSINIPTSSRSKPSRPEPSDHQQDSYNGHPNQPPDDGARASARAPTVRSQVSVAIRTQFESDHISAPSLPGQFHKHQHNPARSIMVISPSWPPSNEATPTLTRMRRPHLTPLERHRAILDGRLSRATQERDDETTWLARGKPFLDLWLTGFLCWKGLHSF